MNLEEFVTKDDAEEAAQGFSLTRVDSPMPR